MQTPTPAQANACAFQIRHWPALVADIVEHAEHTATHAELKAEVRRLLRGRKV